MPSVMRLRLLKGLLWCMAQHSLYLCFFYPHLSVQLCHIFLPEQVEGQGRWITHFTHICFSAFWFLFFGNFPGILKCSVGELVDVAIWKGHLVWRTLPDSGPNSGATGTWLRWQAAAWHLPRYGKSSQQCTSSAWKVTKASRGTSKASSAGGPASPQLTKKGFPEIKQHFDQIRCSLLWGGITAFPLFSTHTTTWRYWIICRFGALVPCLREPWQFVGISRKPNWPPAHFFTDWATTLQMRCVFNILPL